MDFKNFFTVLLLISISYFYLWSYPSEDVLVKDKGRYPAIKIGEPHIIHLLCKNIISIEDSYIGTLGYYQYDVSKNCYIDSVGIVDSTKNLITTSVFAINGDYLMIGITDNRPGTMEGYILIKVIELNNLESSNTVTIRDYDDYCWIIGNIACDDSMFLVVWNDDYGGILGQFISTSMIEEGDTIMISDAAYEPFAASIDYNDKSGYFSTVWTDDRTGFARPYGRIFNRDRSVWCETLYLSDSSLAAHEQVGHPQVLWNTDTTFTVFYGTSYDNFYCQTFAERGDAISSLRRINNLKESADDFAVARDSLGRMVALWEDDKIDKILCQRFNADASLLDSIFVVSSGTYQVPNEAISVDFKDGMVCAVWNDADYRLWLQVFDFENPDRITPEKSPTALLDFQMVGNYPNPFNATTKIRFYLPQAGTVGMKVWDCRGILVRERQYPVCASGWNEIEFKADDLPSGIYLYEVKSGKNSCQAKMLLMK